MAAARTLKVSREKLLAALRARSEELEATRSARFEELRAQEIEGAKQSIVDATNRIKKLEAAREPEDVGEYWANKLITENAIRREIAVLELSEDDDVVIGPTSNFYQYL